MIRAFGFLPRWRIEDIMVSLATQGGGVGPHFDQYDVFLVQGLGQRTWCIGERIDLTAPHTSLPDTASGLNLIDEFEVNQQFIVESGMFSIFLRAAPTGEFPNLRVCATR